MFSMEFEVANSPKQIDSFNFDNREIIATNKPAKIPIVIAGREGTFFLIITRTTSGGINVVKLRLKFASKILFISSNSLRLIVFTEPKRLINENKIRETITAGPEE